MKVNQNIAAVISNTQLLRTEDKLTAAIERLSSGLRINNAKDDPAGLAISNKMKQQIDGIEQASRNTQDGTSALNTADGALNEVVSIIQRMHELAVQAANDTNTVEDREASQQEIVALRKEIDRISKDTEFNTKTLLDGTLDARVYAKGVDRVYVSDYVPTGTYKVNVTSMAEKATFTTTNNLVTEIKNNLDQDKSVVLNVNGFKHEIVYSAGLTEEDIKESIRYAAEKGEADATFNDDGNGNRSVTFTSQKLGSEAELNISYAVKEKDKDDIEKSITTTPIGLKDAVVTLRKKPAATDSNFESSATATTIGNRVTITDKGGFSMDFSIDSDFDPTDTTKNPLTFEVTDIGTMNIQSGANEAQQISVRIPEISSESLYLDKIDLTTINGATLAMDTLDAALARVSEVRSRIGAYSNRMEHANASLGQTDEDLTAAFSRIKDIDMATEMVEYANQQVLQQAATSVLSQANDIPQQVLQLLNP
ncbi:flagellin [Roseburia hominis]|uniref:flagellin N-terminal helical domain-containing protein n=1 Tax=Roseburia hominis TaxID=301301 RepID=UPI001F21B94D|nr:flagellin [Roseburia hominis]